MLQCWVCAAAFMPTMPVVRTAPPMHAPRMVVPTEECIQSTDYLVGGVVPTEERKNTNERITWEVKEFDELHVRQLYAVLELRQQIFVLEQTCLFPDIDAADQQALHLLAFSGEELVAYTRMGDVGSSYKDALTIGRVMVRHDYRGRGLSYPLMRKSIDAVRQRYGPLPITIGAQAHLQALYRRLGFQAVSDEYDEDGIPHIDMSLKASEGLDNDSSAAVEVE